MAKGLHMMLWEIRGYNKPKQLNNDNGVLIGTSKGQLFISSSDCLNFIITKKEDLINTAQQTWVRGALHVIFHVDTYEKYIVDIIELW